jgi:hypothetical protein
MPCAENKLDGTQFAAIEDFPLKDTQDHSSSLSWILLRHRTARIVWGVRRISDHLSPAFLNSLVDKELSAKQLAIASENLTRCSFCAAALLLLSVSIAVIEHNVRRTTIASGKSDAPGTEVCDQASVAGSPAAESELAAGLHLSIQLARWGLLSTILGGKSDRRLPS